MCGIAGFINFDPSVQPENPVRVLRNMLDKLRHRGPDDRGEERIEIDTGPILHLGHQRFSIIDLSQAGHQPMSNDDDSVWISTNSEIYNYRELRNELAFQFHSQSDTEVLLRAYENWGVGCLDRLVGMFSFAIWDSKKEALFIARDRLGIKPLYYHIKEQQFTFASELRSLLASGFTDRSINSTGLYQFLSFGHLKSPESIVNSVRELKPGHYLWIDKNGDWEEKEYWNPFQGNHVPVSTENIEQQVKEAVEQSVQCRRVSDVPLGAFLSGGIDSSVVVGTLASLSDDPVSTLTIGFKEKEFDESSFSQEIADRFKTRHQVLWLDEDQLLEALPSSLSAMDQPTIDGVNTFLISRSAHEAGLKVALSGLGGDELFGGYPSFQLVPKLLQRKKWIKSIPFMNSIAGLNRSLFPSDQSTKMEHWMKGKLSGAHEYFLIRALFCQDLLTDLFNDQKLAQTEIEKDYQRTHNQLKQYPADDIFNQVSYLETYHYLQNMLLRDADMMSMAHPLEVRVPFMDHRLVEMIFRLPGNEKDGTPKRLLVNSMKSLLPENIWSRKKMGFTFPFEIWMRGALRSEIETVLLSPLQQLDDLISQQSVTNIWNEFISGRISWSRPWSLYVLKSWVDNNLS
ncbi:MAG: asparagine synthase (glutamine-hydrolyzing) [Nitrospinae bacterium]|nr:asparagine synthase (glutamine-hydrolyzing) [Nitrospinota bacterium]